MGRLVDGEWRTDWYEPDAEGRFRRPPTRFHDRVTADGSSGFPAEPGRYHLYVSYACPWAQRTLVTRRVRGLEGAVTVSVVEPRMGDDGWSFPAAPRDGATPDALHGARFLRDVYLRAEPRYTGRVTVPVLWDRRRETIVCNESRAVMRMLDVEFAAFASADTTLLPDGLAERVDATLDAIYEPINDGVYRAGFATKQAAYEEACRTLFEALAYWDDVLGGQRFLCGDVPTEADVAMYTTLVRLALVYHGHFKCNLKRLQDHRHLWPYVRDLHQRPGFGDTTDPGHIKTHYYWSQPTVNPTRIVPLGPPVDFEEPHGREVLAGERGAAGADSSAAERALQDPAAVFRTPQDLLRRHDVPRERKVAVLQRWEHDARELQVATDENMGDDASDGLLHEVREALRALGAASDPARAAPTKHGGSG